MRTILFTATLLLSGTALVSAPTDGPSESPCSLTVNVPVGASLSVNGMRTEQMTAVRKFVSPALPKGQKFYYTFVANYTQNGEIVARKKQVEVTAGANVTVDMTVADAIAPPKAKAATPVSPFDSPKVETPKKTDPKKKSAYLKNQ